MKPSRRKRIETWLKIRDAVRAGMTMRDAAEAFNVGYSAVCMRAVRERWNIREVRAGREEVLQAAMEIRDAELAPGVNAHRVNMLATSMGSRRALAEAIRKGMTHLSRLPEEELVRQHKALASFSAAAGLLFGWEQLSVIEGEAAVRTVRAENGEVDSRAINIELVRCPPSELRRRALLHKEQVAQEAKARVVEEAASVRVPAGVEAKPIGSEHSDREHKMDPDKDASREEVPWWEEARARKQARESVADVDGMVASSISNPAADGGMSELAAQRAQQRKESRENFGRCGR
jgi:hypothetical protein